MLRELFIQNLAIIEEARIEFGSGLNVLTGETGAGKSLLVDALELVLGERAKGEWIRSEAQDTRVEAVFDLNTNTEVAETLREAGYTAEDYLVVRRIVSRSGKNRIYINDRAATLGFLEELGRQLVDIHGQHEHQSLLHIKRHRELIDLFGGLVPLREKVTSLHHSVSRLQRDLAELDEEHRRAISERDMVLHQYEEISRAQLKAGEEEELERERKRVLHSEQLRQACQESEHILYSNQDSLVDKLGNILKRLQEAAQIDPQLSEVADQLETAQHYVEEVSHQLRTLADTIEGDPARLEQMEARLADLYRLKRKYQRSLEDLLVFQEELKHRRDDLDNFDDRRQSLHEDRDRAQAELLQAAEELSEARKRTAAKLGKDMEKELRLVGMNKTGFQVDIRSLAPGSDEKQEELLQLGDKRVEASGMDRLEFLIRPNPGQPAMPLRRIASGGELSRIMLALRNVLRLSDRLPTLIFDEVDAGIGGAEAEAVGSRLRVLKQDFQVICITHLPQIAVFGETHLRVTKNVDKNRTRFGIQTLEGKEREKEIARMLGGRRITEKTLDHAREMLQRGNKTEKDRKRPKN